MQLFSTSHLKIQPSTSGLSLLARDGIDRRNSMASFPNLAERLGNPRFQRVAPWLLMLVVLVLLLPGSGTMPLLDRDEPRFSEATRDMMEGEHANWIVPYFNGQYRFDKPVLIYWMMRLSYRTFGVNEFSARLPSVLCTAAMAWLLWHMGRRWFSAACGVFAGFGFITCVQLLQHGRGALADMPMVLGVTLAHYAMFELLHAERPEHPRRLFLLLYGALGFGFLAKGPVALVVPLLTVLIYRFVFWRQPLRWRNLRLELGLPLALLIIAAWGPCTAPHARSVLSGRHWRARGWTRLQNLSGPRWFSALLRVDCPAQLVPVDCFCRRGCSGGAAELGLAERISGLVAGRRVFAVQFLHHQVATLRDAGVSCIFPDHRPAPI